LSSSGRGDIVETLLALEREGATGALEFRAESVLTRIFLERGVPVFAEAGVLGETLGHVLVREQILTAQQFAAVVRKMTDAIIDDENVRFGEVVVELGILTREELDNALVTQVEKKIMGCVHRGVGDWSFDSSSDVARVAHRQIPIRALLVDAAKLLPENRIDTILALDQARYPHITEDIAKIADEFGLEEDELAALSRVDGTHDANVLITTAPSVQESQTDMGALMAALVMGGAVELLPEAGEKAPPSAPIPVTATGRRRASLPPQAKAAAREKAKDAVERFMRTRKAPLPAPRNDREATLFAEDEFQSGKRLFFQNKVSEARTKLNLAVEHAPAVALYQLYADLADSRVRGNFIDPVATKKLAVQIAKEDSECAIAYYVLGYIAIGEGSVDSAKRLFRQAFKLDPEIVDAGRQVRILEMRKDDHPLAVATPFKEIVPSLLRSAKAELRPTETSGTAGQKKRTLILAGILVVVVLAALVFFALKR
jgi:tetratricopeptide (TPR) repeat protein